MGDTILKQALGQLVYKFYSNYSHTLQLQCLGLELTQEVDRHQEKSDQDLLRNLKKDVPSLLVRLPQGHHREKANEDQGVELPN